MEREETNPRWKENVCNSIPELLRRDGFRSRGRILAGIHTVSMTTRETAEGLGTGAVKGYMCR